MRNAARDECVPMGGPASGHPLGALLGPLDQVLTGGGDARLRIDTDTGCNAYGCRLLPRPEALAFASSTATSISERAYARVATARRNLLAAMRASGLEEAFEARIERMRETLKNLLHLPADTHVVFAPSGTDAQLQALFVAGAALVAPPLSVVVAADQTGSGTIWTAAGRHFGDYTAQGIFVAKGTPIAGFESCAPSIAIALCDPDGRRRSPEDIDALAEEAVASAVARGRKVLLHIMDRSKLGARASSRACVERIARHWPGTVQIVVDACQMRLSRARIAAYLGRGYLVLLTGSKFFTGAPFSGALLVPGGIARACRHADMPPGLRDYTNRSDWPLAWASLRGNLPCRMNVGQWLRWEAALDEMQAYFAVPSAFRRAVLQRVAAAVAACTGEDRACTLLTEWPHDPSDDIDDEEMGVRTLFPFVIRHRGQVLSPEVCRRIYRALNADTASFLPPAASAEERRLAARPCHIGQPVSLPDANGPTAALRLGAGARLVSEAWAAGPDADGPALHRAVETVFAKIALLLKYLPGIAAERPSDRLVVPVHGGTLHGMTENDGRYAACQ